MNEGSGANSGPAPEPRTLDLELGQGIEPSSREILMNEEIPQPQSAPEPSFQTSTPPENPEEAAAQSTTDQRIGELINALGETKAQMEQRLEEQRLMYEMQLAAVTSGHQPGIPEKTPDFDPDAPVTAGRLHQILNSIDPIIQERIIRNTWDVTPEEESEILKNNPQIAAIQNGEQKATFIKRAAKLMRASKGGSGNGQTSSPTKSSVPAQNTRQVTERVVPHTESNRRPQAADLRPTNQSTEAKAAYEAAKKIPNKEERIAAMKAAFKKAQFGAGITDESLAKSSFSSS